MIGGQLIPINADTIVPGKSRAKQKVQVKIVKSETGVVASTVRTDRSAATPDAPGVLEL